MKFSRIEKAEQCLIDNGIEPDEAEVVLQALGYILYDEELYPKKKKGKFIVIEGIDGCGKTTQIEALKKELNAIGLGNKFYFTKEPTDGETGKYVRKLLSSKEGEVNNAEFATAFLADRIYHNVNPIDGIKKKLDEGINVICDRYFHSNIVYQGFGEYHDWIEHMNYNCPDITIPDAFIYIDIDPKEACRRINKARGTKEVYETLDKLTDARNKYIKLLESINTEDPNNPKDKSFAYIPKDLGVKEITGIIGCFILDVCEETL